MSAWIKMIQDSEADKELLAVLDEAKPPMGPLTMLCGFILFDRVLCEDTLLFTGLVFMTLIIVFRSGFRKLLVRMFQ